MTPAEQPGAPSSPVAVEPWVREVLRCPACRSELADGTGEDGGPELVCTSAECALAYPVTDGIPVLLVDEARRPGPR